MQWGPLLRLQALASPQREATSWPDSPELPADSRRRRLSVETGGGDSGAPTGAGVPPVGGSASTLKMHSGRGSAPPPRSNYSECVGARATCADLEFEGAPQRRPGTTARAAEGSISAPRRRYAEYVTGPLGVRWGCIPAINLLRPYRHNLPLAQTLQPCVRQRGGSPARSAYINSFLHPQSARVRRRQEFFFRQLDSDWIFFARKSETVNE